MFLERLFKNTRRGIEIPTLTYHCPIYLRLNKTRHATVLVSSIIAGKVYFHRIFWICRGIHQFFEINVGLCQMNYCLCILSYSFKARKFLDMSTSASKMEHLFLITTSIPVVCLHVKHSLFPNSDLNAAWQYHSYGIAATFLV